MPILCERLWVTDFALVELKALAENGLRKH